MSETRFSLFFLRLTSPTLFYPCLFGTVRNQASDVHTHSLFPRTLSTSKGRHSSGDKEISVVIETIRK